LEIGSSSTTKHRQNLLAKVVALLRVVPVVLLMAVAQVLMELAGTDTCQHGLKKQMARACYQTSSLEKLQTDVSSVADCYNVL
jgi:hypothetical protein